MDYYDIDRALVSHYVGGSLAPVGDRIGNSWLSSEIAEEDRLYAAWTLTPFETSNEITVDNLRKNKVRAIRIFPLADKYALNDWVVGDLFEKLNSLKILTFIHITSVPQDPYTGIGATATELTGGRYRGMEYYWNEVYELAKKYHDIPIVLARLTGDMAAYRKMIHIILSKLDNIYIDLSNYHCLNAIEDMVQRHGSNRFLFGTWMPFQDPGQTIAQLAYAKISQSDKEMIGGKNLERLFKEEEL